MCESDTLVQGEKMFENANEEKLKQAIKKYFNAVKSAYVGGNVETSFNRPIAELIELFGCQAKDLSGERTGGKGENTDIKLWRSEQDTGSIPPFGVIEVKKVGVVFSQAEKTQVLTQIQKFGNVIWTNNLEWRFYRSGIDNAYNGFTLIKNISGKLELDVAMLDRFVESIQDFVLSAPSNIKSSNSLARYMAHHAKIMRGIVRDILKSEDSKKRMYDDLYALYSRLKQDLLPELDIYNFADMYAQTIVYGLFIARYNDKTLSTFNRGEAISNLSKESHLLKQFFQHIANSGNLHQTLDDTIDKLCKLFNIVNLPELLNDTSAKDTIIHFYEDFLGFYDLDQRKRFGAYYTPVQVVRYMVGMVDDVLKSEFGIADGLKNNDTIGMKKKQRSTVKKERIDEVSVQVPKVAILDPACGTGTFGAEIIKFIKDKYFSGGNSAFYRRWIQDKNGLMSRLIGFEIMMTSYVVAHLKIRRTITETLGGAPDETLPSNIFLTNTLSEPKHVDEIMGQLGLFDFTGAITEEARSADKWKARRPIKVIIGNPPYLAASKNPYDISAYKFETDGLTKLNERNPKWLNDDYVKFIRFSEQHIEKSGSGVLAFISSNGYLDNQNFRGMRASLLRTFDKIYILNLHGNSNKQETAPDGSKDENVFDIKTGVAIIICVKTSTSKEWAKVYYSDLYGTRERKFAQLEKGQIQYKELVFDKRMAYFMKIDNTGFDLYNAGVCMNDLFVARSTGIVSGNDDIAYAMKRDEIQKRIEAVNNALDDGAIRKIVGRYADGQGASKIQKDTLDKNGRITPIAYRPFDNRWTYYTGTSGAWINRPRDKKFMWQFLQDNSNNSTGLIFTRGDTTPRQFSMIFVSNIIIDQGITAVQQKSIASIAPLYIKQEGLLTDWTPNLNPEHLAKLTQNLKTKPSPQEIFDYCYGVLYDPNYREKYNEFLKRDYPRVPIIENEKMFAFYKNAGERLRKLHLIQTDSKIDLTLETTNENLKIEFVKYLDGKLYINKDTSIVGIPQIVWEYYIGGYQVLDKWFKSHKNETLDIEKFNHIQSVTGILAETIKVQDVLKRGVG